MMSEIEIPAVKIAQSQQLQLPQGQNSRME